MNAKLFLSTLLLSSLLVFSAGAYAEIIAPQRTQGLKAPAPVGDHTLVNLIGPGKFVSAEITKQGGVSDLTFIKLDIDGRNVVNTSLAALRNIGLTQSNPYGLVLLKSTSDPKTFAIGFPYPLVYARQLKLSATVNEANVVQILANVIHGK